MKVSIISRIAFIFSFVTFVHINLKAQSKIKPRVLISTDIGGTDPDDNQSMIHLLIYANLFQIEGLVSTAFKGGSVANIQAMLDLYEQDREKLAKQDNGFPLTERLRSITKQGARNAAPYQGFSTPTEGSNWIIGTAKKSSESPLWILVWGGLEDLAQALHDEPSIKKNIRVYWIGGPNKKWGSNAYTYIAQNHPDLWFIENNATYRGWFSDYASPDSLKGKSYYGNYIKGQGQMGVDFLNYYNGEVKMGDTPSLAYLIFGNPEDPTGESWGGSFEKIQRSARHLFKGNSSITDTVATYAILEWSFKGPELAIPKDSACFSINISGQKWPGYYLGKGIYSVRYSPKQVETGTYITESKILALNGLHGKFVAVNPWPGKPNKSDFKLGYNWYSDQVDKALFIGEFQGAQTISKHRKAFLLDWAKRWEWLK